MTLMTASQASVCVCPYKKCRGVNKRLLDCLMRMISAEAEAKMSRESRNVSEEHHAIGQRKPNVRRTASYKVRFVRFVNHQLLRSHVSSFSYSTPTSPLSAIQLSHLLFQLLKLHTSSLYCERCPPSLPLIRLHRSLLLPRRLQRVLSGLHT